MYGRSLVDELFEIIITSLTIGCILLIVVSVFLNISDLSNSTVEFEEMEASSNFFIELEKENPKLKEYVLEVINDSPHDRLTDSYKEYKELLDEMNIDYSEITNFEILLAGAYIEKNIVLKKDIEDLHITLNSIENQLLNIESKEIFKNLEYTVQDLRNEKEKIINKRFSNVASELEKSSNNFSLDSENKNYLKDYNNDNILFKAKKISNDLFGIREINTLIEPTNKTKMVKSFYNKKKDYLYEEDFKLLNNLLNKANIDSSNISNLEKFIKIENYIDSGNLNDEFKKEYVKLKRELLNFEFNNSFISLVYSPSSSYSGVIEFLNSKEEIKDKLMIEKIFYLNRGKEFNDSLKNANKRFNIYLLFALLVIVADILLGFLLIKSKVKNIKLRNPKEFKLININSFMKNSYKKNILISIFKEAINFYDYDAFSSIFLLLVLPMTIFVFALLSSMGHGLLILMIGFSIAVILTKLYQNYIYNKEKDDDILVRFYNEVGYRAKCNTFDDWTNNKMKELESIMYRTLLIDNSKKFEDMNFKILNAIQNYNDLMIEMKDINNKNKKMVEMTELTKKKTEDIIRSLSEELENIILKEREKGTVKNKDKNEDKNKFKKINSLLRNFEEIVK